MDSLSLNVIGAYVLGAAFLLIVGIGGALMGKPATVGLAALAAGSGYLCQVAAALAEIRCSSYSLAVLTLALWAFAGVAGVLALVTLI